MEGKVDSRQYKIVSRGVEILVGGCLGRSGAAPVRQASGYGAGYGVLFLELIAGDDGGFGFDCGCRRKNDDACRRRFNFLRSEA